jgi:hypothetical protein
MVHSDKREGVMREIICKLFGHQPPIYGKKGWYSPGEEYADKIERRGVDGTGRNHGVVYSTCPRCDKQFKLCRIHIPTIAEQS